MTLSAEDAAREIERLRSWRGWRKREESIAPLLAAARRQADHVQRRLGTLIDLWERRVPENVAGRTRITALRGGVLHVAAESSAVAFELDRQLRQGLLVALRREYAATLVRVKISIG